MKRILILAAAILALTGCIDKGNGEKIGVITKVASQGVWCPTNEIELIRGGLNNGSGASGSIFHATVEDPKLVDTLKEAMEAQREVKIRYKIEALTFCRSESNSHFITSVEVSAPRTQVSNGLSQQAPAQAPGSREAVIERLLATQAELLKQLSQKP